MMTPETCPNSIQRACVSGAEYQDLAEQLDRLRESYAMACADRDAATVRRDGASKSGAAAIAIERQRQINELGYDTDHDQQHYVADLVGAALLYLKVGNELSRNARGWGLKVIDDDGGFYVRANLVKAGAMIAAAIDRLDISEARS